MKESTPLQEAMQRVDILIDRIASFEDKQTTITIDNLKKIRIDLGAIKFCLEMIDREGRG